MNRKLIKIPRRIRSGLIYGMEGTLFVVPATGFLVGLIVFTTYDDSPTLGFLIALLIFVSSILFTFHFFVGRPRNYFIDKTSSWLGMQTLKFNKTKWKR